MSKELSVKNLNLKSSISKFLKKYSRHAAFGSVIVVLLAYIFVVYKISGFAKAEPAADKTASNPLVIPQVDQKAISHIQSLEQSNTQIHTLFEQARTNPFQE